LVERREESFSALLDDTLMAIRSSWKGYLKVSLVSVPLKGYTAAGGSDGRAIALHQLHDECKSRIQYKKFCPIHGEVTQAEIVSGYEYAKGQYVVIDPDELDKLRSESDKSITVDSFVPAGSIDPIYHAGSTYFLVPDGPIGQKPYTLIRQSMAEENLVGVGHVVLSNRERLVLIRPMDNLIAMTLLQYAAQVKQPSTFADEVADLGQPSKAELKLTKQLLAALVEPDFDIAQYKDLYVEKLSELIEAKVEGKELVTPQATREPQIINLMDALKESVNRANPTDRPARATKPPRKMAPSARTRKKGAGEGRRKRSG
jgi:DNA end-binding protein Ku